MQMQHRFRTVAPANRNADAQNVQC